MAARQPVSTESCRECDFDGARWTDAAAIAALRDLPRRWADAVHGVPADDLTRRLRADRWSIAEYTDHVADSLAAMRAVLTTAAERPGTDLGTLPDPEFTPEPRPVDTGNALGRIDGEARALADRLTALAPAQWDNQVTGNGITADPHWIARHAVHDATHHLLDVRRLRALR